uniref:hypothetical protein n=1 Tax=Bacteroides intestinalis TaxID=329854 RepID=UPI0005C8C910
MLFIKFQYSQPFLKRTCSVPTPHFLRVEVPLSGECTEQVLFGYTFVVDNTELLRFYKKILALDYDGPLSNDYILNISAISRKEDAITVEFTTFKQGGIAYSQDGLELTNDH